MTSMDACIDIAAPPDAVWRVLSEPASIGHWMNGAILSSTWQAGAAVEIVWEEGGHVHRDRATVLGLDPGRLLRFSHWSEISRRPDTPAARTTVSLELEPRGDGTRLTLTHEGARGVAGRHVDYFWRVALHVIRELAEGREPGSIAPADASG